MKVCVFSAVFLVFIARLFAGCLESGISWKGAKNAPSYEVRLCGDKACKKVLFYKKTEDKFFKEDLDCRIYYIDVSPIDVNGKKGFPLKSKILMTVGPKLLFPEHSEREEFVSKVPLVFSWIPVSGVSSYVLELTWPDKDVKEIVVSRAKYVITEPMLGKYKWRVKTNVESGNKYETYGEHRTYELYLDPPKFTNVFDKENIQLEDKEFTLEWDSEIFNEYFVSLYYIPAGKRKYRVLLKKKTREKKLTFELKKFGKHKAKLTGTDGISTVKAKPLRFKLIKKRMYDNKISFYTSAFMFSTNITSETEGVKNKGIEENSKNSPIVPLVGLGYMRKFEYPWLDLVFNTDFFSDVNNQYFNIKYVSFEVKPLFKIYNMLIGPILGFSVKHFKNREVGTYDNFKLNSSKASRLPYLGFGIYYYPAAIPYLVVGNETNYINFTRYQKSRYQIENKLKFEYYTAYNLSYAFFYYYTYDKGPINNDDGDDNDDNNTFAADATETYHGLGFQ